MSEREDYADRVRAPSRFRLTEDRMVLLAGLMCAAILLPAALVAAFFLFGGP